MPSNFTKQEVAAFDDLLEGFNDALVMSALVSKYSLGDVQAERSNDTIWRPAPYIGVTFDGLDQTGNFIEATQMSVPASLGFHKSAPFQLSATELRDGQQENRLVKAAREKLASDINVSCLDTASYWGSTIVARPGIATGYDDMAEVDSTFNEIGIPMDDRVCALSSRSYNGMASNLAERQTMNEMPTKAYRKSYVGEVASFETHKMDYSRRLLAATGTGVTIDGAGQNHTPIATTTAVTGETQNYDNRTQLLSIAVGGGAVRAGDAFQIAGVNSVHMITKEDSGEPKTFRVIEVVSPTQIRIAPAIVCDDGAGSTEADARYKNVNATPADGAALTFLNVQDAAINPFWCKGAIELIPGNLVIGDQAMDTVTATSDQGITVRMTREGDINDLSTKYRLDVHYGTVALCPEMMGALLFAQT